METKKRNGPATLLISQESFDSLIECGEVDIIGCYMDLRTTSRDSNPYIEYVIKPKKFTIGDETESIENVIINSERAAMRFIEYPYDIRK